MSGKEIKSPLRYPGGKSRAVNQIAAMMPGNFTEYREPFVGGGSFFINLHQRRLHLPIWINDLNRDLYCFWKHAQTDLDSLVAEATKIRDGATDGQNLFNKLMAEYESGLSTFERAVRFFVLNRITFSGTVDSGGYSQQAFDRRFTASSIERLGELRSVLAEVKITNLDYTELLAGAGEDVFIFLDPPYLRAAKSKLYGRRGALHTAFDHRAFAENMKNCCAKWLITYDDSPEIRRNFRFANIYDWELQYGMNNYMRAFAPVGKELFITNYEVDSREASEQIEIAFAGGVL